MGLPTGATATVSKSVSHPSPVPHRSSTEFVPAWRGTVVVSVAHPAVSSVEVIAAVSVVTYRPLTITSKFRDGGGLSTT